MCLDLNGLFSLGPLQTKKPVRLSVVILGRAACTLKSSTSFLCSCLGKALAVPCVGLLLGVRQAPGLVQPEQGVG